jgi:hypothetical protein
MKTPKKVLMSVYIFNYTNIDAVMAGHEQKIKVDEIGPMDYEKSVEEVITQIDGDKMTFQLLMRNNIFLGLNKNSQILKIIFYSLVLSTSLLFRFVLSTCRHVKRDDELMMSMLFNLSVLFSFSRTRSHQTREFDLKFKNTETTPRSSQSSSVHRCHSSCNISAGGAKEREEKKKNIHCYCVWRKKLFSR